MVALGISLSKKSSTGKTGNWSRVLMTNSEEFKTLVLSLVNQAVNRLSSRATVDTIRKMSKTDMPRIELVASRLVVVSWPLGKWIENEMNWLYLPIVPTTWTFTGWNLFFVLYLLALLPLLVGIFIFIILII